MGPVPRNVLFIAAAWCAGCAHPTHLDFAELAGAPAPDDATRSTDADEAGLAARAEPGAMVRLALAHNPELAEARARVEERLARVPGAERLPDLELKVEQWGAPIVRPYALDESSTLMVGVRQGFPAYGSRDADERMRVEDARAAYDELAARRLDVVREVERAYLEYYLAGRELAVHTEHLELTHRVLELSRDLFRLGRLGEPDVLRLQLEVNEQHRDLAGVEQRQRSAAAMLNTLMGRAPDAPLGPAAELRARDLHLDLARLEATALERRPELARARHMIAGRRADVDRVQRESLWPSFMVGVDYMYMPDFDSPHRYGAMLSINLPWLNRGRYDDDVEAARRSENAETRALEAARSAVRYQLRDAWARYQAALEAYQVTSSDVLPAAQRSFDAAQASFGSGRGDALAVLDASRSLLAVRLDNERARVALEDALVDLERASGGPLEGGAP